MQINLVWDSSVDTIGADEAAFKAAVTYVANIFDHLITNNATVTLNVGYGEITQGGVSQAIGAGASLGGTSGQGYTYAQVKTALQNTELSPEQQAAFGALPSVDPTGGGLVIVPDAEAYSIGLSAGAQNTGTGAIGFGGPLPGTTYDYSTTDRATANEIDFVGVVEHEMAHALGRGSYLGQTSGQQALYSPLDFFRFTSAGTLATSNTQTAYFSINDGATAENYFDPTQNDPIDWSSTAPHVSTGDAFDLISTAGSESFLTTTDLNVMNLLGYNIIAENQLPTHDFNGDLISDTIMRATSGGENGSVVIGQYASGQMTFTPVTFLGPEWSFAGAGDFLADRTSEFLIESTSGTRTGTVMVGEISNGAVTFTTVGHLGAEWQFVETGDFLGHGDDQFLIENTSGPELGALVVGEVVNGSASYTTIGYVSTAQWQFEAAGDFLGDSKDQFLMKNISGPEQGALVVGEVSGGATTFTTVGHIGSEWQIVGAADFLGDGQSQFLMENTSGGEKGALVIGAVVSGAAQYTPIGFINPADWQFLGTGDFLSENHDQFLMENISGSQMGALVVGDYSGGHITYTPLGYVGSEWAFHM